MKSKLSLLLFTLILSTTNAIAQGFILIIADIDCTVIIDGEIKEQLTAKSPKKISLSTGDHFVQAKANTGLEKDEIISIENGKQKILKLTFSEKNSLQTEPINTSVSEQAPTSQYIQVADIRVTLTGGVSAFAEDAETEYKGYKELYYAFEQGDEVLIDGDILNKKGTFFLYLSKYPEKTIIYNKKGLETLKGHRVHIQQRGIYIIRIGTSSFLAKELRLSIKRKPSNPQSRDFVTTVTEKTKLYPIQIMEPTHFYVNSISNETWKGGRNEIVLPVTPPADVLEWFYIVSASRNEEEINANLKSFSLIGDLAKAVNGVNPMTKALTLGVNMITSPPGANYCNVYLLDYENQALFLRDKAFSYNIQGTRENVKSAKVEITCCKGQQYYIGVENEDTYHGIHIGIEVVGVKQETYLHAEGLQ